MVADSNVNPGREKSTAAKKKTTKKKPNAKKTARKANQSTKPPVTAKTQSQNRRDIQDSTSSQVAASTPTKGQSNAGGNSAVSWVALTLSVLALCAGGYAWYLSAVVPKVNLGQQENRIGSIEQRVEGFGDSQSDFANQISQIKNQITQTESNFGDRMGALREEFAAQESFVKSQISNSEKTIASQTDGFRQEFSALSDSITRLQSELGRSAESWALEEVEQLMFIANQRLEFAGEVGLAKQALQLADNRLAELADPALNGVRQLVAVEINALDNVETVDTTAILNQLSVISDNVVSLPLVGDLTAPSKQANTRSQTTEADAQAPDEAASGAGKYTKPIVDAGAALFATLGDMIQVEKNGKSMKPVISAEARQITYEKTQLILESAQIAFVRQNLDLFQNRIASARAWVVANFDQDSDQTQKWLIQLDVVGSSVPQSEMPDISGSLNAIRDIAKSQI